MSNQPNEAAQRYSLCREKSETLVGGVVTTMRPNDQGNWVRYSLLRKAESEIASLRSALAAAEKRALEAWKDADAAVIKEVESRVASIMGSPDNEIARLTASKNVFRDERDSLQIECGKLREQLAHARSRSDDKEIAEKERDAALAKLAEAEKERDEARRAGRVEAVMILMQQCPETFPGESGHKTGDAVVGSEPMADTGDYSTYWDEKKLRALFDCDGPETFLERWQNKLDSETWDRVAKESHIEDLEERLARKEAFAIRFAREADEVSRRCAKAEKERDALAAQLAEARGALARIAGLDYRNAATNGAAYSAHQIASALLAPPSDRGAEDKP